MIINRHRTIVLLALFVTLVGVAVYYSRDRWRSPAIVFASAKVALRNGDVAHVERAIAQLKDRPAYAPHCHFLQGALLLRQGKLEQALDELQHAIAQPELETDTLVLVGQALYQQGRAKQAHDLWQRALSQNPAHTGAHRWLGILYYDFGAMDDAIKHLEQVSKLDQRDPRPDRLMGLMYRDFEKYREAVGRYRESLRRQANQPDREDILLELAECEMKLTQYAAALETLRACSPSAQQLALQAECHFALGDFKATRGCIEQALATNPEFVPALALDAKLSLQEGQVAKAVEVLRRLITAQPTDHAAQQLLATALGQLGKHEEARHHAELAQQLQKKWEEFSKMHTRAIEEPWNGALRYRLGEMANELGRRDLAENWFRAALAIDPHLAAAKALEGSK